MLSSSIHTLSLHERSSDLDIFGWFVDNGVPYSYERTAADRGISIHELLSELAADQPVGAHGLLALDWHSGNRSPLVDHELSGLDRKSTRLNSSHANNSYAVFQYSHSFPTRTLFRSRHLRLVRRQRRAVLVRADGGRSRHLDPRAAQRAGRRSAGRRARVAGAGLALGQPVAAGRPRAVRPRSEEHTSELQSRQ